MKTLFRSLIVGWICAATSYSFAQDAAIAELDPEMAVSKTTVDGLDWYDVTQWGVEGRILPDQDRQQWSVKAL